MRLLGESANLSALGCAFSAIALLDVLRSDPASSRLPGDRRLIAARSPARICGCWANPPTYPRSAVHSLPLRYSTSSSVSGLPRRGADICAGVVAGPGRALVLDQVKFAERLCDLLAESAARSNSATRASMLSISMALVACSRTTSAAQIGRAHV